MKDIEEGLKDLVETVQHKNIQSIAMPALGCGLGGLDWPKVKSRIEKAFQPLLSDVNVTVFEPQGRPANIPQQRTGTGG